jgi:hypothetical protein
MPHRLLEHDPASPMTPPLMATLRYRCPCTGREIITVNTVFNMDASEEAFVWAMQMMWRDMRTEIRQHTKGAG